MREFRKVHQFNTFSIATPLQVGIARYLDEKPQAWSGPVRVLRREARPAGRCAGGLRIPAPALGGHVFPAARLQRAVRRQRRRVRRPADPPGRRRADPAVAVLPRAPDAAAAAHLRRQARRDPRPRGAEAARLRGDLFAPGRGVIAARCAMSLRVSLVQSDLLLAGPGRRTGRGSTSGSARWPRGSVDLVVLPEMFTTGFSMDSAALAEPAEGPSAQLAAGVVATPRRRRHRQRDDPRRRALRQPTVVRHAGRRAAPLRQAPPVPHGGRARALRRRWRVAGGGVPRLAHRAAGLLRPALPGLEPAARRLRLRPARLCRQLAGVGAPTPGDSC